MVNTPEKLNMIYLTFQKGLEILEILKEQLSYNKKKETSEDEAYKCEIYEIGPVDKIGKMTFSFAGMKFFIKIRIKFQTEEGFNQYSGLLDWGMYNEADREQKEVVKITNEYKWTEKRIFLVENINGSSKSHIIKDDDNIQDFIEVIHNNIYSCLPNSLKFRYI